MKPKVKKEPKVMRKAMKHEATDLRKVVKPMVSKGKPKDLKPKVIVLPKLLKPWEVTELRKMP